GQRVTARPHDDALPRVAGRLERRHDTGAHERRLARARGTDDRDERLLAQARDRARDVLRAAEEAVRVALLERVEARIRALVGNEVAAGARWLERLEIRQQICRRRVARCFLLREALLDDRDQAIWNARDRIAQR